MWSFLALVIALTSAAKPTVASELREIFQLIKERDARSPIATAQEEEANEEEDMPISRDLNPGEAIPTTYGCVDDRGLYTEETGNAPLIDPNTGLKNLEFWVTVWGMSGGSYDDWYNWCLQCGNELEDQGVICGGWSCRWWWGSIGLQRDGRSCPKCAPNEASVHIEGHWTPVEHLTVEVQYVAATGVSRTMSQEETSEWTKVVTASASTSMDIGLPEVSGVSVGVSTEHTISGSLSETMAQTFASSVTRDSTNTRTYTYGAGTVWQWVFDVNDNCGKNEIRSLHVAHTPNMMSPPCCLPGYFQDPTNNIGACADGTPAGAILC